MKRITFVRPQMAGDLDRIVTQRNRRVVKAAEARRAKRLARSGYCTECGRLFNKHQLRCSQYQPPKKPRVRVLNERLPAEVQSAFERLLARDPVDFT